MSRKARINNSSRVIEIFENDPIKSLHPIFYSSLVNIENDVNMNDQIDIETGRKIIEDPPAETPPEE